MGVIATYIAFAFSCFCAPLKPQIGAAGYVTFVAFVPHWLWRDTLPDAKFEFQKFIALATLVGLLIHSGQSAPLKRWQWLSYFGLGSFLLLSFVSSSFSIDRVRSWEYMDSSYKVVMMAFVLTKLLNTLFWVRLCIICLLTGIGWNAFEINADYYANGYSLINQELGWAFMNANGYALVLLLVSLISAALALEERRVLWIAGYSAVSLLCVNSIYIIESRGCMVGMIFGGVCLFAYTRKNFRTFAIFSATAICALALAGPSVIREFSSSFEENLDESAHSRFHIWSAGLNLTADYPLLGVGPFAGEKLMVAYYPVPTTKPAIHLHNLPLEIATGSGLVALIGYVAFFFIPIYKLHKFLRQSTQIYTWQQGFASGTLASLLAYWLASLFNSGSLIEIPYIVVALAIAMVGIEENNTTTEQMHVPSHVDCLQGEH